MKGLLILIISCIPGWFYTAPGGYKGEQLDDGQQKLLSEAFDQIYGISENQRIIDLLEDVDAQIEFLIDPDMKTPGAYDRKNRTIYFRSSEDINYHVLLEEIFHAYQHQVISIGAHHYDQAHANIEFEAKLYSDLIQLRYSDYLIGKYDLPLLILGSSSDEYIDWLSEITGHHNYLPSWELMELRYYEFLREFSLEKTAYDSEIDLKDQPVSLFSVFDPENLLRTRK